MINILQCNVMLYKRIRVKVHPGGFSPPPPNPQSRTWGVPRQKFPLMRYVLRLNPHADK